jgi:hypothetical protein
VKLVRPGGEGRCEELDRRVGGGEGREAAVGEEEREVELGGVTGC